MLDEHSEETTEDMEEAEMESATNSLAVECCGFCNSELSFVSSGGMDGQLKIWDLNSGTLRVVCAHGAAVVSLRWHATMPIVTTACLDNHVRLWDARNGNLVVMLTGHSSSVTFVTSATFQLKQKEVRELEGVVSVSDDTTVRFFATDLKKIV